jgi:glutathione synthase/RimK-type ligase-like ATP-grasp enzyme
MIQQVFKIIQRTLLTIASIKGSLWIQKHQKTSENIVLIYPDFPNNFLKYFYSDAFINDIALINAVASQLDSFRLKIGKNFEPIKKNIYLNINNRYATKDENYADAVYNYTLALSQKNNVFPKPHEVLFWENKVFMHRKFDELGISTPKTAIIPLSKSFQLPEGFAFPCLLKEVHSAGSNGVYKVNNVEEGEKIRARLYAENPQYKDILLQSLLTMDRDLRVILIGNEVVLHYWRINLGKEWKPTSTKHGSGVDFQFFPNEWKSHIIETFNKLGITTGAFDLVWEHNDYTKPPVILEVSPSYQPNPTPPSQLSVSYGKYKSGFRLFDSWDTRFLKEVNRLKTKLIAQYKQQ